MVLLSLVALALQLFLIRVRLSSSMNNPSGSCLALWRQWGGQVVLWALTTYVSGMTVCVVERRNGLYWVMIVFTLAIGWMDLGQFRVAATNVVVLGDWAVLWASYLVNHMVLLKAFFILCKVIGGLRLESICPNADLRLRRMSWDLFLKFIIALTHQIEATICLLSSYWKNIFCQKCVGVSQFHLFLLISCSHIS